MKKKCETFFKKLDEGVLSEISDNLGVFHKIFQSPVQDVHRYNITVPIKKRENTFCNKYLFERIDDIGVEFEKKSAHVKNDKTIVLLLESPHKDEFNYTLLSKGGEDKVIDIKAKAPASGMTGVALDNYLFSVLLPIINKSGKYRILMVNPIQYQTSLHAVFQKSLKGKYKDFRDDFWKLLWNFEYKYSRIFQNDFKERLSKYNPNIIVNCCTSKLKKYVSCFLIHLVESPDFNFEIFEGYHPAINWFIGKRELKRID